MKKLLKPLLIILIATSLTSCCMFSPQGCLRPEVSAGVNYANQKRGSSYSPGYEGSIQEKATFTKASSTGEDTSGVLGLRLGVGAKASLDDHISIETGLFYSGKGVKISYPDLEEKWNLSYLDIPILARYGFSNSNFSLFGGLQPSVLLSSKQTFTINGTETEQDLNDYLSKFDLAASLGVGYKFDNGFGLDLGYDLGLVNLYNDTIGYMEAKNRVLRLSVNYTFSKKKSNN